MNISGIRPYEGFYQYNSIKQGGLRGKQIAESEKAENAVAAARQQEAARTTDTAGKGQETAKVTDTAARQRLDSYDYAKQYRPDETFDLKGLESDIESLDAKKAVSDLEKDKMLQQYQYFVGDKAVAAAKENVRSHAAFRLGENFLL